MTPAEWTSLADYADMHVREYADQITNLASSSKNSLPEEVLQLRSGAYAARAKIAAVVRIVADDEAIRDIVAQQLGARV